jgi:hypothetical protein
MPFLAAHLQCILLSVEYHVYSEYGKYSKYSQYRRALYKVNVLRSRAAKFSYGEVIFCDSVILLSSIKVLFVVLVDARLRSVRRTRNMYALDWDIDACFGTQFFFEMKLRC